MEEAHSDPCSHSVPFATRQQSSSSSRTFPNRRPLLAPRWAFFCCLVSFLRPPGLGSVSAMGSTACPVWAVDPSAASSSTAGRETLLSRNLQIVRRWTWKAALCILGFDDGGHGGCASCMDKFATLEPTKLHSNPTRHQRPASTSHVKYTARQPVPALTATKATSPPIGKLPADLHVLVLAHLPIPDVARYARASRATCRVARDERVWERRWLGLAAQSLGLAAILDELEAGTKHTGAHGPATLAVSSLDDDFGDFASAPPLLDLSSSAPLSSVDTYEPGKPTPTFRAKYVRAHTLIRPLLPAPNAPPHVLLASLSSRSDSLAATLLTQARVLHLLGRFLSPAIKPVSTWDLRLASLKASLDRFDASLLTAFDAADTGGNEGRMKEVASASWEVSICLNGIGRQISKLGVSGGDWEMGRLWAEKREVFYEQGKWDPSANFTCVSLPLCHTYF
jgi:recyclin-1